MIYSSQELPIDFHESISPTAAGINMTGMTAMRKLLVSRISFTLDPFQLQGDKQQDYTIYTGWYRQWKKIMQQLSQKRESDDYHKLNKKLHDFKLILVSLFVVQTDLLHIALYHRGCFFCSQPVTIQTNVIIIGISPGKPCIILMVCHTTVV